MKKTLVALAALAATGAFAQVTVYGRLDAGYANTVSTVTAGTAAPVEYKANGVQSHNSVSSMWGIKGTEDLGGGMNAYFQLEQDLYTANGNTGASGAGGGASNASGFNRTSKIGVNGAFGDIAFGRDYNPVFKIIAATDINALSRVSTVQMAANTGTSTVANQVIYSSPVMSGFQVNYAYGSDDAGISGSTVTTVPTTTATTKTSNLTATYVNGPLFVAAGVGSTETVMNNGTAFTGTSAAPSFKFFAIDGVNPGVSTGDKITGTTLAGSYDFGKFKLVGNMITGKTTTSAGVTWSASETNLGAVVPMGKLTLKAQIGTNKLAVDNRDDYTGSDMVLGADYALSAKTAAFVTTGTFAKLAGNSGVNAYDGKVVSTAVGLKTVF